MALYLLGANTVEINNAKTNKAAGYFISLTSGLGWLFNRIQISKKEMRRKE